MLSLRSEQYLGIVHAGLQPRAIQPRKVIVVGAGMAGLVAAYELHRAGHAVVVLEARQRVGGRILTVRDPFSPGLYAEAGAMRLPTSHALTAAYINGFGLPTTEYSKPNPNTVFYFNGHRHLRNEVDRDPQCLDLDFAGPTGSKTVLELWEQFVRTAAAQATADEGYWDAMLNTCGDPSLYEFLKDQGWSPDAITAFASITGWESSLGTSFLEILQVEVAWHGAGMRQIAGGMDRLPMAFLPTLERQIRFGAEMVALDYTSDTVTVHYKTESGHAQVTGDFAILTLPYPVLRFVDVLKAFSPTKQMAIRQIHYINSVKILLECGHRFWEDDEGIFGGATVTDLPIRTIHYPDHGRQTGRGVLIGCYAYGEDADRWGTLSTEERIVQTVKYVAHVHPQLTQEFVRGFVKLWGEDKFAGGACAWFEPGQPARLLSHIVNPEGPVHFAGEHTSLKHGWIEGAVESGLRAAQEVHDRSFVTPDYELA